MTDAAFDVDLDVAAPVDVSRSSATEASRADEHREAPGPTGRVGRWLRALRAVVVSLARRGGAVAHKASATLGTADAPWWEPAPARIVSRSRAGLRLVLSKSESPGDEAGRRPVRWGQALTVGLVAFTVWVTFDAPTLLRSAEASPLGARRSAAIIVLRPIAAVSHALGLSHVVGAADRIMGRTGGSVVQQVGPPTHHRHRVVPRRVPAAAVAPTAPAAPSDALPPVPAPTAASPLRVLSVGDSLGVDFGGPFVNDLAATGVVNAALDAHVDTGLARPDYFDWPGELQADLAKYQPQVVVVFLGANDPQNGLVVGNSAVAYGSPEWSAEYASRVGSFMQEATAAGARVLWVGMPPMADPGLNAKMQVVDGIYQSQAGAHPGVTYLSSWPVLSDAQGAYAEYLPDSSGNQVTVREPDGTHVSPGGAERLSQAVIGAMDHTWGLTLQP